MTAPTLTEPCFDQPKRTPLGDSGRIRVVQLLATGSNGGAQEATWSLVRGMDHGRYDVELVSLTDGPTVRRFERAGYRTTVIDGRDDQDAVGRLVGPRSSALVPRWHWGRPACRGPTSSAPSTRAACGATRIASWSAR
jgi:hypothetical protein